MKKANNTPPEQENPRMPLTRRNYILLAVGFAVVLLGFVLMAGGGSDSPDEFNTPCSRGAASRWPRSWSSAVSSSKSTPS